MRNLGLTKILTAALAIGSASAASAEAPELKTPAPVIYLADNLDEKDNLGFCIDTVGRGLSDRLHAHSCKPQGGDVQFRHDATTGQIASAAFDNLCAQLMQPADDGVKLALVPCSEDGLQKFDYDAASMEIRPAGSSNLCLASPGSSRSAGPFMSRDLILVDCASSAPSQKQWVIKAN